MYVDIFAWPKKHLKQTKAENFSGCYFFFGATFFWGMGDNVHFSGTNAYANATMLICSSCCLSALFFCLFVCCLALPCRQLLGKIHKKVNSTGPRAKDYVAPHSVRVINYRIPGVLLKNMCVSLPDDPPLCLFVWDRGSRPGPQRCPEEAPPLAKILGCFSTALSKIVHKLLAPPEWLNWNFSTGSCCLLNTQTQTHVTLSFDCGQLAVGHPWRKLHAYPNPQRTLGADPSRPSRKPQGRAWGTIFQVEVVPPVPRKKPPKNPTQPFLTILTVPVSWWSTHRPRFMTYHKFYDSA